MTQSNATTPADLNNEERRGQVALKAFFNITAEWGCSQADRQKLLGDIARSTLNNYAKLPAQRLNRDLMERISYIMGIYKALQILYPTRELAARWVHAPNSALPFNGVTALEFMKRGSILHLAETRRYLDAQRGW
ncbi:MbcA/ParS/Xre antitoxin family protein [Marinobacter nanhaiticus D15-8W]|uniref:DUF2384 domain-containing protein n=1 Tax=Marinobacter nanhaiticus D15-8W TaxID=626887 RepID=N6WR87_9GAMM|nr:MbcA/ParS/Xre antitoxin family protein [Marinobacter nanhaiticus]ENO14091.1 DUF2384 domain-containing protein [Marinobacter nanhaiticus D15-8W]BES71473.1 MbcA/ParS/Xre antitoxin family protein [Marinobacter nanhaiticus D15-8W]